jgi:hypothetical protein
VASPSKIGLPADETTAALAAAITTGDYNAMPTPTRNIWPWLGAVTAVVAVIVWVIRRRRRFRNKTTPTPSQVADH